MYERGAEEAVEPAAGEWSSVIGVTTVVLACWAGLPLETEVDSDRLRPERLAYRLSRKLIPTS